LIIIFIGLTAIAAGQGDVSRVLEIRTPDGGSAWLWPVIAATTLAFFAMVGFEDSVTMAEECTDPTRMFPKVLLAGLLITGIIYVLVSISAITLVPPAQLGEGEAPRLRWWRRVRRGSRSASSPSSPCSPSPTPPSSTC
jgi:amino acid transporter